MPKIGFKIRIDKRGLQRQVNLVTKSRGKVKEGASKAPRASRGVRSAARRFIDAANLAQKARRG